MLRLTRIRRKLTIGIVILLVISPLMTGVFSSVSAADIFQEDPIVDPELMEQFNRSETVGYLVYFDEQADLSAAYDLSWEERGQYVYDALTQAADSTQTDVRAYLDQEGVTYQSFWVQNVIAVDSSTRATFDALFSYAEIYAFRANPEIQLVEPVDTAISGDLPGDRAAETNLTHINVDDAWSLGYTGTNLVVASIDTGVHYTHETLLSHYRGNQGGLIDHDYNWWDAVSGIQAAYDDNSHGTHTVGIMVGDDGAGNQIGVAPGATWIACKALNSAGSGTSSDLLECGQYMLAPTRADGTDADPDKRPNIINNSWGDCGQTYNSWYEGTIDAWEAAGIYPVFANGNAGNCGYSYPPGLDTVGNPGRSYHVTGVGSTGHNDGEYALHSNWGPTDSLDTLNPMGYADLKPQVVAPGVSIRSSVAGEDGADNANYAYYSGTSMSAPHVAGMIALMWQAGSCLIGDYVQTETLIQTTADPVPYDTGSGGEGPGNVPNYATGWGEINAEQAVIAARDYCGDSLLNGYVLAAGSGQPIEGAYVEAIAQVTSDNDRFARTDANGYYLMPVHSGETYDITASKYGYYDQTIADVAVTLSGGTVTTNFNLNSKPAVTLSGLVTDASGHGYPLYARVLIETGEHTEETFTNPFDGVYQVDLFVDTAYDLLVTALSGVYQEAVETSLTFTGPTVTRDYPLLIGPYCEAQGYSITKGLSETFDEEVTPSGWTVVDDAGEGVAWRFDDPDYRSNYTGGEGGFAIVDSDNGGFQVVDTSLISPSVDFSGQSFVTLAFDQDFFYYDNSSYEKADVDVSISGGAWQNVLHQTESQRGPDHQELDISALAGNQADVRVRFHYYDALFDWWWQVDNVRLGPFTCSPDEGGVIAGLISNVDTGSPLNGITVAGDSTNTQSEATPSDHALVDGLFWLFQPLTANPQTLPITASGGSYTPQTTDIEVTRDAITRQDFALDTFYNFIPFMKK